MQKGYLKIVIGCILLIFPLLMQAQGGGPNGVEPQKNTKLVRGCLYEVVPGLAEITKIEVNKTADKSLLQYNEHQVLFKFTPMGNTELLACLKENELEFTLRSNRTKIPVGPQYIQQKGIRLGTKYAMNMLQIKDKAACLEQYTYESKILNNDLFEAEAQIIPFMKGSYSESKVLIPSTKKLENCLSTENPEQQNSMNALGINEDSLRALIRIEKVAKYQNKQPKIKASKSVPKTYQTRAVAIKKARVVAREKKKKERALKKRALAAKKERRIQLKALKVRLEREVDLEIQEEMKH